MGRGTLDDHVVAVPGTELDRDEGIRPDTSLEALAKLRPAFAADGTVTAGNSSPLNDGAGAILVGDKRGAERAGREPLARIAGRGASGSTPTSSASRRWRPPTSPCAEPGSAGATVDVVELNEAFASQSLACLADWADLDPEKVNPNGGAIAIGHPLGASGVRILATLAHELRRRGGGWGLAAICIGVGQGLALVLEA